MKIIDSKIEDKHILLTIESDVDCFKKAYSAYFQNLSKKVNIPGFRKGKAPLNIVVAYVKSRGFEEAENNNAANKVIDLTVNELHKDEANEWSKKIFGRPVERNVKSMNVDNNYLLFEVKFEKIPEVVLSDYSKIPTLFEAKDLEDLFWTQVKKGKATENDLVLVGFFGKDSSSNPVGEYTYDVLEIDLAKTKIHKDIRAALVGVSAGDKKTVELFLSKKKKEEGEPKPDVILEITVREIRERIPATEEEFKKLFSSSKADISFDSALELLKTQLKIHNSAFERQELVKWLLSSENKFDPVPTQNLRYEAYQAYQKYQKAGHSNISMDALFSETFKNLKMIFVLDAIADKEGIKATPEDKEKFFKDVEEKPWLYGYKSAESLFSMEDVVLDSYVLQFKVLDFLSKKLFFSN